MTAEETKKLEQIEAELKVLQVMNAKQAAIITSLLTGLALLIPRNTLAAKFKYINDFDPTEFDYPDKLPRQLLEKLQLMRAITRQLAPSAGWALIPISDYRDPVKNAEVGGAKNSPHLHGNAVDLKYTAPGTRDLTVKAAVLAGFKGIGIYTSSVHVDIHTPYERFWGPDHTSKSAPYNPFTKFGK